MFRLVLGKQVVLGMGIWVLYSWSRQTSHLLSRQAVHRQVAALSMDAVRGVSRSFGDLGRGYEIFRRLRVH